jgi:hypothetical protein
MINMLTIDRVHYKGQKERSIKAVVLHSSGEAPQYEEFAEPTPEAGEVLVHVKAASLTTISKMMASGSHYDTAETLLQALTRHDVKAEVARTRYVSIKEMAGSRIALSSATLRSSGVELYGSGGGSIALRPLLRPSPSCGLLLPAGNCT